MRQLIFILFLTPQILFSVTNSEFSNWWVLKRDTLNAPEELRAMEDHFVTSGLLQYSSNYWNWLNIKSIEQISSFGYENFKQTVAQNYFTWVVGLDNQYAGKLQQLFPQLLVTLPAEEIHKIHPLFGVHESIQFNTITQYLLNYVLSQGGAPYLQRLEEPIIGNPPCIKYNNKRLSQDILNSLLEYMTISQYYPLEKVSTIIEIGAGSGRTAFCIMSLLPHAKYVIVDIPPALYISQKYLSEVFPNKKVFQFRPFMSFEEIASEYAAADIVFLMPDQLEMLPDQSADLFLAIDCLHEMKPERIATYFNEADRLCSYLYFKCWQHTVVPYDHHVFTKESYPVHSTWTLIMNEPCDIPGYFFHAMYRIGRKE